MMEPNISKYFCILFQTLSSAVNIYKYQYFPDKRKYKLCCLLKKIISLMNKKQMHNGPAVKYDAPVVKIFHVVTTEG